MEHTNQKQFKEFSWAETQHEMKEAWKDYKSGKISLQEYKAHISKAHLQARVSNVIRLENKTRGNNLLPNPFLEQTK